MSNEITFQALVDIEDKEKLKAFLVLPRLFKNILSSRWSQTVTLVGFNEQSYNVRVVKLADSRIILTGDGWAAFVRACVEQQTAKLCFRLRQNLSFDVVAFDADGEQLLVHGNADLQTNKCLISVTDGTTHEEYVPFFFLHDLDVEYRRHTKKKATLLGPNQMADVEVIYEKEEAEDDHPGHATDDHVKTDEDEVHVAVWRAVGFTGPKWLNLCYEHEVSEGGHIMLTKLGAGSYLFDYFNEEGLGLDAATPVSRAPPASVKPTLTKDYVTESEGEEEDSLRHRCKFAGHKHHNDRPFFFKKLTDHSFTTKVLTLPGNFVRQHQVNQFTKACVYVGRLKFKAKLDIMYDARRDGDESHVLLITDWLKVSLKTGYVAGRELRFEVNVVQSVDGPTLEFHVC